MKARASVNVGIYCEKYKCSTSLDEHTHAHNHIDDVQPEQTWLSYCMCESVTVCQLVSHNLQLFLNSTCSSVVSISIYPERVSRKCISIFFFVHVQFQISNSCPRSDQIENMNILCLSSTHNNRLKLYSKGNFSRVRKSIKLKRQNYIA